MKQKGILLVITFAAAMQITACGKQSDHITAVANPTEEMTVMDTIKSLAELETRVQTQTNTEETRQEEVPVRIYYVNRQGDGLQIEERMLTELTADKLVTALGIHNIVSIDTKVQGFEEKEENGVRTLYLDLSKHFKEYIGMMGSSGEAIVMESLVNTFLDNYDAERLILTVNGAPLKTGHNDYTEPLEMYAREDEEEGNQQQVCELTEERVETERVDIKYPQFTLMPDTVIMNQWNAIIKEKALGYYDETSMRNYKLGYEVTTQNAGVISILFKGEFYADGAAGTFAYSYNFDLTTGKNLRLEDYGNMEQIDGVLREGTGCEILPGDVPGEEINAYLRGEFADDRKDLLRDFDYDLDHPNVIPTGYSYIRDDSVILIILVNHELGDYVEIRIL